MRFPGAFQRDFREPSYREMRSRRGTVGHGVEEKRGTEVGRPWDHVRLRTAHKGSFASVSPPGFIEPHGAWHGVPATVLYAMYQNATHPNYRGTTDAPANRNVSILALVPFLPFFLSSRGLVWFGVVHRVWFEGLNILLAYYVRIVNAFIRSCLKLILEA